MPTGLLGSHAGVPINRVLEDAGNLRDGLDVVHHSRARVEARNRRERRLQPWVTAAAFQGIKQRSFLATDVCTRAGVGHDLQIPKNSGSFGLGNRRQDAPVNMGDLATQVQECLLAPNGMRGNGHALYQTVRVRHDLRHVLASARLRFVAVYYQVPRATVVRRQEGPLHARREACAATASQAGRLNRAHHVLGLHCPGLLQPLITPMSQVVLKGPRPILAPVFGEDRRQSVSGYAVHLSSSPSFSALARSASAAAIAC